jgi:hypothetical protein
MSGGIHDQIWNQVAFPMVPALPDGGAFLMVVDIAQSQIKSRANCVIKQFNINLVVSLLN